MEEKKEQTAYDPINDPVRDSQKLPAFERCKYNQGGENNTVAGKQVLTNSPFSKQILPEIEIFSHEHFNLLPLKKPEIGAYRKEVMLSLRTTFGVDLIDHPLYNATSSIIVYSGNWQLYGKDGKALSPILGPGHYDQASDIFGENDSITRFEPIDL